MQTQQLQHLEAADAALLLHELAREVGSDHLDRRYYESICDLGAQREVCMLLAGDR